MVQFVFSAIGLNRPISLPERLAVRTLSEHMPVKEEHARTRINVILDIKLQKNTLRIIFNKSGLHHPEGVFDEASRRFMPFQS
jgi:hypothetical protein